MMLFNDLVKTYKSKSKATSNIKIQKVLTSIGLDIVNIYLRDGPFESDIGIVNLHPSEGTHWVTYNNEKYFDSYGCVSPKKLSKFIIKRNGYCLYYEYQIQKNDSFCANYCLHIIYLTKIVGIDFKFAVFKDFRNIKWY